MMACPHNARNKTPEGVVYQNSKCLGCSYCAANCPFKACKVDINVKRSYSCWMCYDRITNGMAPACVKGCPTEAISFGDREQLVTQAKARLNEVKLKYPEANLYGVDALGGMGVIYLLLKAPAVYDLPAVPTIPNTNTRYGSANGVQNCFTCHSAATVTYPGEGQTVSGTIMATAYGDAKGGMTKVEFYIDTTLVGASSTAPFQVPIDTTKFSNGLHTIKARGYSSGGVKSNTTNFYIQNSGGGTPPSPPPPNSTDTTPPSVIITNPTGGSIKGTITVKVNATDNVGVAKVDLAINDQFIASKTTSPFDFTVDTTAFANGKATIKAVATDVAGNSASTQVNVKISN
jgi:ferredoxin